MKKILSFLVIAGVLSSCGEDVKFNSQGFQGYKDGTLWQANDARATMQNGNLIIEGYKTFETVTLSTNNTAVGTYVLGTTDVNNSATYASTFNGTQVGYATAVIPGPASIIEMTTGGTGYGSGTAVPTTGGAGSGLTVNVVANASGAVTSLVLSSRGSGYKAGDVLTVSGGNNNCKFKVVNVLNSNGEIQITEFDNVNKTVTGTFKFNAAKQTNTDGSDILNFQYGAFYKIPIKP